ncbi:MAG: hypothetical protein A2Y38_20340 [Spirochaetes bacterium GWB1_59_5]|nr:MAG: hypothetical protein A2Y38_20340 [Spirochaetes bacterium GWB1_59_5]
MVAADDLVCGVRLDSIRRVAVVVDVEPLDGLPCIGVIGHIVAQCETSFYGFMERLPLSVEEDLRVLAQAPVEPLQTIADLPTCVFDRAREPVIGASAAERGEVRAGLRDAERLGPNTGPGNRVIPAAAHEREAVGRIADDRVDHPFGQLRHSLATIAVDHAPSHESLSMEDQRAARVEWGVWGEGGSPRTARRRL